LWLRGYRSPEALPVDSPVRLAADAFGLHLATKTARSTSAWSNVATLYIPPHFWVLEPSVAWPAVDDIMRY
jgi:hypothetical protein